MRAQEQFGKYAEGDAPASLLVGLLRLVKADSVDKLAQCSVGLEDDALHAAVRSMLVGKRFVSPAVFCNFFFVGIHSLADAAPPKGLEHWAAFDAAATAAVGSRRSHVFRFGGGAGATMDECLDGALIFDGLFVVFMPAMGKQLFQTTIVSDQASYDLVGLVGFQDAHFTTELLLDRKFCDQINWQLIDGMFDFDPMRVLDDKTRKRKGVNVSFKSNCTRETNFILAYAELRPKTAVNRVGNGFEIPRNSDPRQLCLAVYEQRTG